MVRRRGEGLGHHAGRLEQLPSGVQPMASGSNASLASDGDRPLLYWREGMSEHKWSLQTLFCLRCGAALRQAVEGSRSDCSGAPNVIPISDRLSRRFFERTVTLIPPGKI